MTVSKVGVIGAGQMGNGIAHVMALAGYDVKLNDVNPAALEAALGVVKKNMARQLKSGKITETDQIEALSRIKRRPQIEDLGACDLIIEAATEDEKIKQEIFNFEHDLWSY